MTSKSEENYFENEENHQIFCKYWKTKESPELVFYLQVILLVV